MAGIVSADDLLAGLKKQAAELGLKIGDGKNRELTGEAETIGAKWWLGGRKVTFRMSCRLSDADRTVYYREVVAERSWGIPPPTLKVEATTTSGWKRSGERTDVSVGGGGSQDYARVRNALEKLVTDAGWIFKLEGGRMP